MQRHAFFKPYVKCLAGLIFLALGFLLFYFASHTVSTHKASLWWVVFAYLFFAISDLTISAVTLSQVTRIAPMKIQSQAVGFYFFGMACASYLSGMIAKTAAIDFSRFSPLAYHNAAIIYGALFFKVALFIMGAVVVLLLLIAFCKNIRAI